MNEQIQKYKEITKAVKESGIPLPLQKEIQDAVDEKFKQEEKCKKLSPMLKENDIGTE